MSDMLAKLEHCQKALSVFLEEKRSKMPRFYFIGDEDLLEIIGNSKDTEAVGHHLGKMFAGLARLSAEGEKKDMITAMGSKEGETVAFKAPVSTATRKASRARSSSPLRPSSWRRTMSKRR